MTGHSKLLDSLLPSEKKHLIKLLDHRAVTRLNGKAKAIEETILSKTNAPSIEELLSRIHAELIETSSAQAAESSITYFLNDPRVKRFNTFTGQAVRIMDNSTKKYVYINDANEHLSGLPNEIFLKKGLKYSNRRTHPWDLMQLLLISPRVFNEHNKLSDEDKLNSRFSFDLRYNHPDRGYIRIQQHVMTLSLTEEKKPALIMIVSNDITDIKTSNRMHYVFGVQRDHHFDVVLKGKTGAYGSILTQRELEILSLCAEGLNSVKVAEKLFISPETAKKHIRNIIEKTESKNITEVVKKAVIEEWI